jgi:FkbM family methyltransferase
MDLTRIKALLGSAITHRSIGTLISGAYGGQIPFRGRLIETRNPYVSARVAAALRWGLYEKAELNFVRDYLRPELDVIELGASLGVVTLEIASKQAPGKTLVSVEANPHLIRMIQQNVENNSSRRDVQIVNAAVDYSGRQEVDFTVSNNNLVSRLEASPTNDRVTVTGTTLECLLRRYPIGEYALVADIEGAEAGLILSDAAALARCRQIVIELHKTSWKNVEYTIEMLADKIQTLHGFTQIASHGAVYVFDKS